MFELIRSTRSPWNYDFYMEEGSRYHKNEEHSFPFVAFRDIKHDIAHAVLRTAVTYVPNVYNVVYVCQL